MAASIPNFDEKLESWDSYQERLEHYFIALDIDDPNKKKSILINCVGPANYERVRNLCFPSSPNDKLYDELLVVFGQLFTPSIVVFKERKQFYDARKHKNEKATSWHERLRGLAINCKFGVRTEQTLLDKFVTSYDGVTFDRFCEEGTDLALPKALEIAQRYETIVAVSAPQPKPKPNEKNETQKGQQQQHKNVGQKPNTANQAKGATANPKKGNPKKANPKLNVNTPVTNVILNVKRGD